jgi:molecular chaperone HtpG
VEDNGIGMTADEVEKYITQIAFSGAEDFLAKYEKASDDGIIGHFGLGFYSAYMVSENVEIYTKSYKNEPAVKWVSDGNSTYTLEETEKAERGTKIVMHIAKGEEDFLKDETVSGLLRKYCSFMPFHIYLNPTGDAEKDKPVNDTTPLYLKNPKDCTDEEYKNFYRNTFMDYNEPLFWIHLNMDYPFRLKGILYFPQIKKEQLQLEKAQVKLYCNQVFIADNIKEVIPEFLMLLNGVIDCPDIPLNVSRSFLQNDKQVQKISKHITKKVADKLTSLYKTERERYENCWKDISTFIKFGCMRDEDFYEKVKDILIFKSIDGTFKPLNEILGEEISEEEAKEGKQPKAVYYVSDEAQQAQYVRLFKDAGLDATLLDTYIDGHFVSFLEYKNPKRARFIRIDADVDGALKGEACSEEDGKEIVEIFKKYLPEQTAVKVENLKTDKIPAVINVDEFARRMSEMQVLYGMDSFDPSKNATLVLNLNNPIVSAIKGLSEEKQRLTVLQIYYLALISYKKLTPEELAFFVENSTELLGEFIK